MKELSGLLGKKRPNNIYKAIILCAGIGKRTKKNIPKCLLKIGNETLIQRHIRILQNSGINDINVVIGSEGICWSKKNINKIYKYSSKVVINKFNIQRNRVFSFYCGISSLNKSNIIVIDGDLIYNKKLIIEIINSKKSNLLLSRYHESQNNNDLGSKIKLDNNGFVKSIGYDLKSNLIYSGIFKLEKGLFDFLLDVSSKKKNWNKNISYLFERLIEKSIINVYKINTQAEKPVYSTKPNNSKPLINKLQISGKIIKKSSTANRERLINEMNFLINLPKKLKPYFSRVLSHQITDEMASYSMPYYNHSLFSDLIIDQKISKSQILNVFQSILDFCFIKLYKTNRNQTPKYFLRMNYFDKFKKRLVQATGKSKLFDSLILKNNLVIDNQKMINAPVILDKIINDNHLLSILEPPYVSLYHGDFRLGNILIDESNFILIDPRGLSSSGMNYSDPIEDIAKLFSTSRANYDLIQMNKITYNIINEQKSAFDISVNEEFEKIAADFKEIPKLVFPIIQKYLGYEEDYYWELRLKFIEALLLISLAPYKLISENNENACLILYLEGVKILNEFTSHVPKVDIDYYNLVNVNYESDIKMAEKIFAFS